jgi:hypothetical protein
MEAVEVVIWERTGQWVDVAWPKRERSVGGSTLQRTASLTDD